MQGSLHLVPYLVAMPKCSRGQEAIVTATSQVGIIGNVWRHPPSKGCTIGHRSFQIPFFLATTACSPALLRQGEGAASAHHTLSHWVMVWSGAKGKEGLNLVLAAAAKSPPETPGSWALSTCEKGPQIHGRPPALPAECLRLNPWHLQVGMRKIPTRKPWRAAASEFRLS